MVEQQPQPFDTYQAFATRVFEQGVHEAKPAKTPQLIWDDHVEAFAVLAFNTEATLKEVSEMFNVSDAGSKSRRLKIEDIALSSHNSEFDCFTKDKLQVAYVQRPHTYERRRYIAREREDPIVPLLDFLERGGEISRDSIVQTLGSDVGFGEVRRKLTFYGYKIPDDLNKPEISKIEARRKQIENPDISPEKLKEYFNEMTKSYFERLALRKTPTLVSFLHTLQGFGVPLNRRSSDALRFLGNKLFERDIVIGILPLMVRQEDGTYRHRGTYYYHRNQDTERIEDEEEFIRTQLAKLKEGAYE